MSHAVSMASAGALVKPQIKLKSLIRQGAAADPGYRRRATAQR